MADRLSFCEGRNLRPNQRGTTEENNTIANNASRKAKHDSKELPRIVPTPERSVFAVNVLFRMNASY